MRLKIALTHAAAAAALVLVGVLGHAVQTDRVPDVDVLFEDGSGRLDDGQTFCAVGWPCDDQPYCPTEDSCTVDYADGRWTVREVTP